MVSVSGIVKKKRFGHRYLAFEYLDPEGYSLILNVPETHVLSSKLTWKCSSFLRCETVSEAVALLTYSFGG